MASQLHLSSNNDNSNNPRGQPNYAQVTSYQTQPAYNSSTNNYSNYGNPYIPTEQQHGTGSRGENEDASRTAAAALGRLSAQDYNQQLLNGRNSNPALYDRSSWSSGIYGTNTYPNMNHAPPNRSLANHSPLYATQSVSTMPNTSSASRYQSAPSNSFTAARSYQPTHHLAQQQQSAQPPSQTQRYESPVHAAYTEQQQQRLNHDRQSAREFSHQPSAQMAAQPNHQMNNRHQSPHTGPNPTTVDPSQVYNFRAEQQKKAEVEAERQRMREAEEAARKIEAERVQAEKRAAEDVRRKNEETAREVTRKAEEAAREATRKTEEAAREVARKTAEKKAHDERQAEERRKAKEQKQQNRTAATTLQKLASSGANAKPANSPMASVTPVDEEAEMRAMFQKMREFHSKNPSMLAKLWEEERRSHASSPPARATPTPAPQTIGVITRDVVPSLPPICSNGVMPPSSTRPVQSWAPLTTHEAAKKSNANFQKPVQQHSTNHPRPPLSIPPSNMFWPAHKKASLAETAARWLMSLPVNAGKVLRAVDILKILESNPSYVQLCEALEKKLGLGFERSLFARELLGAVPEKLKASGTTVRGSPASDINGTSPQVNETSGEPLQNTKPSAKENSKSRAVTGKPGHDDKIVKYDSPSFPPLVEMARAVADADTTSSMTAGGPVRAPQVSPNFSQPLRNGNRPPLQPQPSVMKPEIKLEGPRNPPANKEEAARKRTFTDLVDLTADDSDVEEPAAKIIRTIGRPTTDTRTPFKEVKQPKQIHPPAQNLIDLTGQVPPAETPVLAKPKGPSQESLQQERIKGKVLVEPIMRDRVARKSKYDSRTIARDVLLATGRHPDMRALNAHLGSMAKLLGLHGGSSEIDDARGNRSDLATIKWDIIDPNRVKTAAPRLSMKSSAITDLSEADEGTESYPASRAQSNAKAAGPQNRKGRPRRSTPEAAMMHDRARERLTGSSGHRGGANGQSSRPADTGYGGFRANANSDHALVGGAAPTQKSSTSSAPVGYAAFQQYDENGNKKKGRPLGWRKSIHGREAHGLAPANSHHASASKPRQQQKTPRGDKMQEPHYQVYKCRWKGCTAELHNLDTLKRHVVKLHGRQYEDDTWKCLWRGCKESSGKQRADNTAASSVASFDALDSWMNHVDKEHLQSVAWRLGDGPRGGMSDRHDTDAGSEAYLSDAHGRSVTPLIRPELPEATSQVTPSLAHRAAGPALQASSAKGTKEAVEEVAKLERRIRRIGPSLCKTGSTLANKKRRLGFLDDEDFEDIEEEDDDEGEDNDDDEENESGE